MSKTNPVIYYIIIRANGPNPVVRAVHLDGTTRDWHKYDQGYKSARARANASFKRQSGYPKAYVNGSWKDISREG